MREFFQKSPVFIAGLAIAGISALTLFLFDPAHYPFYPTCYFHLLTGLYCPGCGGLRAIHQLLHGNLAAAARLNLLVILSLPAAVLVWRVRSIRALWLWVFLAFSAVFAVVRNIPGGEWLRP